MNDNLITEFLNAMKADDFNVRETDDAYIADASRDMFGHTHRIILNKSEFSVEFYKDGVKVFEERNLNSYSSFRQVYEYVDFEFDYFGK